MEVGDRFPDFVLKDENGEEFDSRMLDGVRHIVYFYPKDNTPGCTKEAVEFTVMVPKLMMRNIPVIGISKDYNNFELRSALVAKDVLKANRIIQYFDENPKANPIQVTLAVLFGFFSNLMLAYYAPDKSEAGIANFLELKSPWQSREYLAAMRCYSGTKTMRIIESIRYADAYSKGVGNSSRTNYDILRELIFNILH